MLYFSLVQSGGLAGRKISMAMFNAWDTLPV